MGLYCTVLYCPEKASDKWGFSDGNIKRFITTSWKSIMIKMWQSHPTLTKHWNSSTFWTLQTTAKNPFVDKAVCLERSCLTCLILMPPLCVCLLLDALFSCRMWGNSISDEGAEAFAGALRHHPRLTNLRWDCSYLQMQSKFWFYHHWLISIFRFLCSSLSANCITSKGGQCLAEALKENSVLRIFW